MEARFDSSERIHLRKLIRHYLSRRQAAGLQYLVEVIGMEIGKIARELNYLVELGEVSAIRRVIPDGAVTSGFTSLREYYRLNRREDDWYLWKKEVLWRNATSRPKRCQFLETQLAD